MNLKQLEAFVSVADTGSFSRTAKNLYLTQPTISAHISALETELNARLLIRNTKEVRLSEQGKKLYQYARQMLDVEREINMEFGISDSTEKGGRITIAASTIPAQYVLPQLLAGFRRDNPEEEFELRQGDSADVIDKVVNGEVQLGFTGMKAESARCRSIPFYHDQLVIMTPATKKFLDMKQQSFNLSIFYKEPLIVRENGSGTRRETEKYLESKGVDLHRLKITASMDNPESIRKAVASGLGITVISSLAAAEYEDSGKALIFQFPGEKLYRELNVVYSNKLRLRPSVRRLVRFASTYQSSNEERSQS